MPLLEVSHLRIGFRDWSGKITTAVEDVNFTLERGAGLAVVGESGSGKSVTALALTKLLPEPPAVIESGTVKLEGQDVLQLTGSALQQIRGRRIGYIFQEPASALNPVYTVESQIGEVLRLHRPDVADVRREIVALLDEVGITRTEERLRSYPHELSGGMQQRVMIAMALAARPDVLIADEPTTALDVTIQAQIMDLLARLKQSRGMALMLITHNFGIIRKVADEVVVMLRGKVVEQGPVEEILGNPQHAYTKALIACVPKLGTRQRRLPTIGDLMAT
jgi:ABC-type dipeptide/oligopeptide/nickel transport system ATPase component